jgi:tRNA (cmo5U34)-methyltransferase
LFLDHQLKLNLSQFEESGWSKPAYSREYRDQAAHFIPERETLLDLLASFYRSFVGVDGRKKRVLDLGCGDGVLGETLLRQDPDVEMVLVDGSAEMLAAARVRLAPLGVREYAQATFAAMIEGRARWPGQDLIVSSFAIHHLEDAPRRALFGRVFEMLNPDGFFLNIDIVLPADGRYEDWYYEVWREWIQMRERALNPAQSLAGVPAQARSKPENHYRSWETQLADLRAVGFTEAACHYRYGLFGLYSARKP